MESSRQVYKVEPIIVPTSQMRKAKLREVE